MATGSPGFAIRIASESGLDRSMVTLYGIPSSTMVTCPADRRHDPSAGVPWAGGALSLVHAATASTASAVSVVQRRATPIFMVIPVSLRWVSVAPSPRESSLV